MKNGASQLAEDPSRPSDPLNLFDHFVGSQHDDHPPLKPFEVAKLDDLRDDMVWWLDRVAHHPASKVSFLGRVFADYEKRWSKPLRPPPSDTPHHHHVAAFDLKSPARPFDGEYELLDQLSVWYGGQYRGVIVTNYRLAMIAGCVGLLERSVPLLGFPEGWIHGLQIGLGLVEVALIAAIIVLFFVGRTPRRAFRGETRARKKPGRRWHQRWIEYRVLAERFRYAALLQPFGTSTADEWRRLIFEVWDLGPGDAPPAWHDRYFLWRLERTPPRLPLDEAWIERLIEIMREQASYHARTGEKRGNILHRLHHLAMFAFGGALAASAVRLVLHFATLSHPASSGVRFVHDYLVAASNLAPYVAGFLALIAGAIEGVLGTAEYSKLSSSSLDMAARINTLRTSVERTQAQSLPVEQKIASMEPEVRTFCRLVTNEASGWVALLRDKDVPLAH